MPANALTRIGLRRDADLIASLRASPTTRPPSRKRLPRRSSWPGRARLSTTCVASSHRQDPRRSCQRKGKACYGGFLKGSVRATGSPGSWRRRDLWRGKVRGDARRSCRARGPWSLPVGSWSIKPGETHAVAGSRVWPVAIVQASRSRRRGVAARSDGRIRDRLRCCSDPSTWSQDHGADERRSQLTGAPCPCRGGRLAGASAAICDVSDTIRRALGRGRHAGAVPWPARRRAALPSIAADLPARRVLTIGSPRAAGDASRRRAGGAKVAPLIERLRDCSINDGDDPQELRRCATPSSPPPRPRHERRDAPRDVGGATGRRLPTRFAPATDSLRSGTKPSAVRCADRTSGTCR